jgi:hypothetical protein
MIQLIKWQKQRSHAELLQFRVFASHTIHSSNRAILAVAAGREQL